MDWKCKFHKQLVADLSDRMPWDCSEETMTQLEIDTLLACTTCAFVHHVSNQSKVPYKAREPIAGGWGECNREDLRNCETRWHTSPTNRARRFGPYSQVSYQICPNDHLQVSLQFSVNYMSPTAPQNSNKEKHITTFSFSFAIQYTWSFIYNLYLSKFINRTLFEI